MIHVRAENWGWRHAGRKAWAVRHLSFHMEHGERVLLLGPSGAGKSTLLAALAGVLGDADEGEEEGTLTVDGSHPRDLTGHAALMMQDPESQIVLARVGDDVAFGCENMCVPTGQIWPQVCASLSSVGLDLPLEHPTDHLSGGRQQRLVLAGALAMGADLLVLDEPTANLDPAGVVQVRDAVAAVLSDRTKSLIVVEHHCDVWESLVDRVLVLAESGIVADGTPNDVFSTMGQELADMGVWVPRRYLCGESWPASAGPHPTLLGWEIQKGFSHPSKVGYPPAGRGQQPHVPMSVSTSESSVISGLSCVMRPRPAGGHPTGAGAPLGDPSISGVGPAEAGRSQHKEDSACHLMTSPLLVGKSLSIGYGKTIVRQGLDVEIPEGMSTVITGTNGSGKTTLALTLAGLIPPLEGEVEADQLAPQGKKGPYSWKSKELLTRIGTVFQSPEHQFVTSSVFDEIAVGLRALKKHTDVITEEVTVLLDRLRLAHLAKANPFTLSGGEKRRLSVATVLACHPRVIVLDEPTFGQDRLTWVSLVELVSELRDRGTTIVSVTHDHDYVDALGEHLIDMGAAS